MKKIAMDSYYIIGENADKAAEVIDNYESEMVARGAANYYFSDDYYDCMESARKMAAEKFGVTFQWF